jgi:hypothetical protein
MIRAASETAPDFYANRYCHNGIKTPDRRMDGAVSLSGLMMRLIFPFRSTSTLRGHPLRTIFRHNSQTS